MLKDDIYSYSMLFNSLEFQTLNKNLNKFNPLKVLKSSKYEIRHSNILAWLLTPNENHNMNEYFLKGFIAKLLSKEENIDILTNINLDISQILRLSSYNISIEREVKTSKKRYIDLLIISKTKKFVFLIENKFYSKESENQLNDYLEFVRNKYKDYSIIPVFLTLNSLEPSSNEYLVLNYNDIIDILKNYLCLYSNTLDDDVRFFIKSYIEIIEEETLENSSDIELASSLYKEFSDIINNDFTKLKLDPSVEKTIKFIKDFGNTFMIQAFDKFKKQDKNIIKTNSTSKISSFALDSFRVGNDNIVTPRNWWFNLPFILWFERLSDKRLKLTLELGPINFDERILIINKLEKLRIKISDYAKRSESNYTRLFSKAIPIEDWANSKEIFEVMNILYNNADLQDKLRKIETIKL